MEIESALVLPQLSADFDGYLKSICAVSDTACDAAIHVTPVSSGVFRVAVTAVLSNASFFSVRLRPAFQPEYSWIPHLTPEAGYVADMHVFRTPAVIFEGKGKRISVIPDLESDVLCGKADTRAYLDLDAENGYLEAGVGSTEVTGHVLFKRQDSPSLTGSSTVAFYLILKKTADSDNRFRDILDFIWSRRGSKELASGLPHTNRLTDYCDRTFRWAFDSWKDVVYQEFSLDGVLCGAPTLMVITRQSPNYTGAKTERESRSVWNQAWFSSLRSASGLYRYAKRTGRGDLLAYANRTKELALHYPRAFDGLFYSVLAAEMEPFYVDGERYIHSLGWSTAYFGNSDRSPFNKRIREAPFHILDMSFTAYYMLLWHTELEPDTRLLDYVKPYADKLLLMQSERGFFPGWVSLDGVVSDLLTESCESAMSAVFLLRAAEVFGEPEYRAAALRAVEATAALAAEGKYEDFETYWSCCRFWSGHVGEKIARNDLYKQCNLSMFYVAWSLYESFCATGDRSYLTRGAAVLDELLMTQASYQPGFMPIPVLGGFGVLNADAEWNDARQSLFAELILQYGRALDCAEYQERGEAALKAAFGMMYCPENTAVKEQWEKLWPFLNETDYGFSMENYGHNGRTGSEGLGIGEFTIYDWGNGAASEAVERMLDHGIIDAFGVYNA